MKNSEMYKKSAYFVERGSVSAFRTIPIYYLQFKYVYRYSLYVPIRCMTTVPSRRGQIETAAAASA